MEDSEELTYTKVLTPFYKQFVNFEQIVFQEKVFKIVKTRKGKDRLPIDQLEKHGVFDPNLYKKDTLLLMCKKFIRKNDFMRF